MIYKGFWIMYHKAHAMILCDFLWFKIWTMREHLPQSCIYIVAVIVDGYWLYGNLSFAMCLAKITNTISKWYKNIFRISKYGCMYGSSLLLTFTNKNTLRD